MTDYIISESDMEDLHSMIHIDYEQRGVEILQRLHTRPLSSALKAEREKVLNKIIEKLVENPLSDCGIESMNRMGEIVESLRSEQP